jgi:hypothetical protein
MSEITGRKGRVREDAVRGGGEADNEAVGRGGSITDASEWRPYRRGRTV